MSEYGNCFACKAFSESVFSCVDSGIISKLISNNSISISYRKGQDVYIEGAPAKGVFCIQEGKVKIYKGCAERNITIDLADNSDLIGYQAIFNGNTYTNSAKCLVDSQICFIPKAPFLNTLTSNENLLMHMLKISCRENHKLSNQLRDLKCKNTLSRIALTLVGIKDKFGLDENKCLNVSLTRKEISELSGTTTESVIRILNDLRNEKVVDFYNNRIIIKDVKKLLHYQE